MKLYNNDNTNNKQMIIEAKSCQRPKFSSYRGRKWENIDIQIDGKKYDMFLDVSGGKYYYFIYNDKCYKISVFDVNFFHYINPNFYTSV